VTIVRELALANASAGGGVIAILSDRRKSALEAELASALKTRDLHGTRVVFRTGSRLRAADLRKVATQTARAIIVVSDGRLPPHSADAEVLQVVLNLATLRLRRANVVVEVRVSDNEVLLHLVSQGTVATVPSHDLCGALMLQFARQPGLARVYTSVLGFHGAEFYLRAWPALEGRRFAELARLFPDAIPVGIVAYADGTCELNPRPERVLAFGDKLVVIAEDDDSYAPLLPPPQQQSGAAGAAASFPPDASCFVPLGAHAAPAPERVMFAGWRRDMPSMMQLLDRLVAPGSELHVVCALPVAARLEEIAEAGVSLDNLRNLTVVHHVANTAVRRQLEALPLDACSSMIIASDAAAAEDVIHSDSHALATLLLVRGIQAARRRRASAVAGSASSANLAALAVAPTPTTAAAAARVSASDAAGALVTARDIEAALQEGIAAAAAAAGAEAPPAEEDERAASMTHAPSPAAGARPGTAGHGVALRFSGDVMSSAANLPIVCEILDPRTQRTVTESTPMGLVSDFIQSNDLVSKILAQVAEDPLCKAVLDQLLGGTGTQFAVVAAEDYVAPRVEVSFAELAAHCSAARRCVLCGYIEPHAAKRSAAKQLPACVLNPARKDARRAWGGYSLIVIATDMRLVASNVARQSRCVRLRCSGLLAVARCAWACLFLHAL
jgi:hypothetical protein